MSTLATIGVLLFILGYLIPAGVEFYERMQYSNDEDENRVSPFSIRSGWFTAFSAVTVGLSGFLIYRWTGGKIQLPDRELAAVVVLAGSTSAFLSFVIMKWFEGVVMALGYMWENTVVARRKRIAAQAKAEGRAEGLAEGLAEGRAEMEEENARLKARIAELERNRNGDGE